MNSVDATVERDAYGNLLERVPSVTYGEFMDEQYVPGTYKPIECIDKDCYECGDCAGKGIKQ